MEIVMAAQETDANDKHVEPAKSGCYASLDQFSEPEEPPMKKQKRYFNQKY